MSIILWGIAVALFYISLIILIGVYLYIIVMGFKKSIAWGLGTLIIPPIAIAFSIMHREVYPKTAILGATTLTLCIITASVLYYLLLYGTGSV